MTVRALLNFIWAVVVRCIRDVAFALVFRLVRHIEFGRFRRVVFRLKLPTVLDLTFQIVFMLVHAERHAAIVPCPSAIFRDCVSAVDFWRQGSQ